MPSHFLSILKRFRLSPFALQNDWCSLCHHTFSKLFFFFLFYSMFRSYNLLMQNMLSLVFLIRCIHAVCLHSSLFLFTYALFHVFFDAIQSSVMHFYDIFEMLYSGWCSLQFSTSFNAIYVDATHKLKIFAHIERFYRRIISSILLFTIFFRWIRMLRF